MVHRVLASVVLLGFSFWIIDLGGIDTAIQDWIYDPASQSWPITKSDRLLRLIFYDAPKIAIIAFAAGVFAALLWSFWDQRWAAYRRHMAFLLVILALVPGIASLGKAWTNIYCPAQLSRYGGSVPRTGLLEPYPKTFVQEKRGRCFPAGHASGGFALLALFFVLNRPAARIAGLITGLGAGWLMGGYQMLIGAHFLSHTIFTMVLAWILCVLLEPLIPRKAEA